MSRLLGGAPIAHTQLVNFSTLSVVALVVSVVSMLTSILSVWYTRHAARAARDQADASRDQAEAASKQLVLEKDRRKDELVQKRREELLARTACPEFSCIIGPQYAGRRARTRTSSAFLRAP
jgi:cell division protein FtsL